MPELPEVETTRRGLAPRLEGRRIIAVRVREPRLRWPVPAWLAETLAGRTVERLTRRAKYLLMHHEDGCVLLHLGMSGSLTLVPEDAPPAKHDHLDIVLEGGEALRLRDPRRFGAVLAVQGDPMAHPLLRDLGPEPLGNHFSGRHLHERAARRRVAVKPFIMDAHTVVGVGNIYASEALFEAGIHPTRPAGRISSARYERLAGAIRRVLRESIEAGGTTLRDYVSDRGAPGAFARELRVYGRRDAPCPACGAPIRARVIGQRSSFYCPRCQR